MRQDFSWSRFYTFDLASIGVTVAGLVAAFTSSHTYSALQTVLIVVVGLLYMIISLTIVNRFFEIRTPRRLLFYFLIEGGLGGLLVYLSAGSASLALMPLVAQTGWLSPLRAILITSVLVGWAALVAGLASNNSSAAVQSLFNIGSAAVFVLIFIWIFRRSELARAEVERLAGELGQANGKLREYSVQVEELATTKERNRLAREIHDSLGHYFTVINVQIEAAKTLLRTDQAGAWDALQKAQSLTKEGLGEVRRSISALRISPLENKPLPEVIGDLAEENQAAGIITNFKVSGQPRSLPPQALLTLYRAAQEGLTNVRKHSCASQADLWLDYSDSARVRLTLRDNGTGMATEKAESGFGLLGLRERVQLLDGQVRVKAALGQGFQLEVELPTVE